MLLALHKPYGFLSQFTPEAGSRWRPLADLGLPGGVYPIGRLDADSEGLLLLSDEAWWNDRLLHPRHGHRRTYWAQVEREPAPEALARLAAGVVIEGRSTLPCRVRRLPLPPELPPRDLPVRIRKTVADAWLELELREGRNRQVRKMTAAVGHPTLRLVRVRIGGFALGALPPGHWRRLEAGEEAVVLGAAAG